MVDDSPRFSALPHEVIRDRRVSRDARLLYAVLQMYWWRDGECRETHATLAADLGCSVRMLPSYLDELIAAGRITEHDAGARRQKVYRPVSIGTVLPIETPANAQPASDCRTVNENQTSDCEGSNRKRGSDSKRANRQSATGQSEVYDTSNRKRSSDSKKKTPVKKTPEDPPPSGEVAAGAAPVPAPTPKSKRSSTAPKVAPTKAPEAIDLTERHLTYAAEYGFTDPARVRAITDHFLSHHRFKGTKGLDWYAGWQGWIRRQREIDDERAQKPGPPARNDGRPRTNGTNRPAARPVDPALAAYDEG